MFIAIFLCFGATHFHKSNTKILFLRNFLIKDQTCKVFIKDGISGDCKSYRSILITLVVNKLVVGSAMIPIRLLYFAEKEHRRVGFLRQIRDGQYTVDCSDCMVGNWGSERKGI